MRESGLCRDPVSVPNFATLLKKDSMEFEGKILQIYFPISNPRELIFFFAFSVSKRIILTDATSGIIEKRTK